MTDLPARARGVIGLVEANCTVCMLCAKECPVWCIHIDSHKETVTPPQGRPRVTHVMDRFAIDFGLCMLCGICLEVCPFDALVWSPEHGYSVAAGESLVHEREQLAAWAATAPPPPPLDPAAGPAPERPPAS